MIGQSPLLAQAYITLDGELASHDLMTDLLSVEVDDALLMPDMFALRFNDPTLHWVDAADLAIGTEIKIEAKAAEGGATRTLVRGEITAIEPDFRRGATPVLTVRGYDRSHRLHRGRRTRTFQNVSDSDLAESIARDHQLTPKVTSSRVVHDYVIQSNQTDFEFLTNRASRVGYDLLIDDKDLVFEPAKRESGSPIELDYGTSLLEFCPRLTMASQFEEVLVSSWDPATKKAIEGTARTGASPHRTGFRQTGPEMASKAFGDAGTLFVAQRPVATAAEADELALALSHELAASLLQADGVAIGDPALAAGCLVRISALGDKFSGTYLVSHVRHVFTPGSSYVSHLTMTGRNSDSIADLLSGGAGSQVRVNQDAAPAGLVCAIVTNNVDPDDIGRVRVKFPWLDDESESFWARVVAPMSGADRGWYSLPEVNDEVVVGFEHGDMSRAFVVGGLWNGRDAPPLAVDAAVSDGKVMQRVWRTRAGHEILFDDSDKDLGITIALGDSKHSISLKAGSSGDTGITLDADGNRIVIDSSKDRLAIEIDGDAELSFRGKLKVEAQDIAFDAKSTFEIKAKGKIAIESQGQVQVKGSAIQLN